MEFRKFSFSEIGSLLTNFTDINEKSRPEYLAPIDCLPKQEITDASTSAAFQDDDRDDRRNFPEFPQQMDSSGLI